MAQQKFFSGLTEGMINRSAGERPDRQKSHFFWPDEYAPDVEKPKDEARRQTGGRGGTPTRPQPNGTSVAVEQRNARSVTTTLPTTRTTMNGSLFGEEVTGRDEVDDTKKGRHGGTRTAGNNGLPVAVGVPTRDRLLKNTASHIKFYDDVESSFGELERSKAHERRRIEQFLRQQSDEDTGEGARAMRLNTLQSKIEFYDYPEPRATPEQRVLTHRVACESTGSVHDSDRASNGPTGRTFAGGGSGGVPAGNRQERMPVGVGGNGSDEALYQDDEFEFDDRSSYRSSVCSSSYAPSGYHRTAHAADLPEHKRNSQRHLRSNFNFHDNGTVADDREPLARKPVSVRDSATNRVGVGLPDL